MRDKAYQSSLHVVCNGCHNNLILLSFTSALQTEEARVLCSLSHRNLHPRQLEEYELMYDLDSHKGGATVSKWPIKRVLSDPS